MDTCLAVTRPKGTKNKVTRELRVVMDKLEREEVIHPRRWFTRLEAIALSEDPDRVSALRVLLAYRFGQPQGRIAVEHALTESAEQLLRRIAASDEHRLALETLERRRQIAGAVTVEPEPEN